jgi:hypothetical protein
MIGRSSSPLFSVDNDSKDGSMDQYGVEDGVDDYSEETNVIQPSEITESVSGMIGISCTHHVEDYECSKHAESYEIDSVEQYPDEQYIDPYVEQAAAFDDCQSNVIEQITHGPLRIVTSVGTDDQYDFECTEREQVMASCLDDEALSPMMMTAGFDIDAVDMSGQISSSLSANQDDLNSPEEPKTEYHLSTQALIEQSNAQVGSSTEYADQHHHTDNSLPHRLQTNFSEDDLFLTLQSTPSLGLGLEPSLTPASGIGIGSTPGLVHQSQFEASKDIPDDTSSLSDTHRNDDGLSGSPYYSDSQHKRYHSVSPTTNRQNGPKSTARSVSPVKLMTVHDLPTPTAFESTIKFLQSNAKIRYERFQLHQSIQLRNFLLPDYRESDLERKKRRSASLSPTRLKPFRFNESKRSTTVQRKPDDHQLSETMRMPPVGWKARSLGIDNLNESLWMNSLRPDDPKLNKKMNIVGSTPINYDAFTERKTINSIASKKLDHIPSPTTSVASSHQGVPLGPMQVQMNENPKPDNQITTSLSRPSERGLLNRGRTTQRSRSTSPSTIPKAPKFKTDDIITKRASDRQKKQQQQVEDDKRKFEARKLREQLFYQRIIENAIEAGIYTPQKDQRNNIAAVNPIAVVDLSNTKLANYLNLMNDASVEDERRKSDGHTGVMDENKGDGSAHGHHSNESPETDEKDSGVVNHFAATFSEGDAASETNTTTSFHSHPSWLSHERGRMKVVQNPINHMTPSEGDAASETNSAVSVNSMRSKGSREEKKSKSISSRNINPLPYDYKRSEINELNYNAHMNTHEMSSSEHSTPSRATLRSSQGLYHKQLQFEQQFHIDETDEVRSYISSNKSINFTQMKKKKKKKAYYNNPDFSYTTNVQSYICTNPPVIRPVLYTKVKSFPIESDPLL